MATDKSVSLASITDRALPVVGAILITASGFALLFLALAHLIPAFLRFSESPAARLLPAASILVVLLGGWVRFRHAKSRPTIKKRGADRH
jgi:hypothetical protein